MKKQDIAIIGCYSPGVTTSRNMGRGLVIVDKETNEDPFKNSQTNVITAPYSPELIQQSGKEKRREKRKQKRKNSHNPYDDSRLFKNRNS